MLAKQMISAPSTYMSSVLLTIITDNWTDKIIFLVIQGLRQVVVHQVRPSGHTPRGCGLETGHRLPHTQEQLPRQVGTDYLTLRNNYPDR